MRRRNGDEQFRELERAALAGDVDAAVQLEELRSESAERGYVRQRVYGVDTPVGRLALRFERPDLVQVGNVFPGGLDEDTKDESGKMRYDRIGGARHRGRPVTFHGHVDLKWQPASGRFEPTFFLDEAMTRLGVRNARFHADNEFQYAPMPLAREREVVRILADAATKWVAEHPEAVAEAERRRANNKARDVFREIRDLEEKLLAKRERLAREVVAELRSKGYSLPDGPRECSFGNCGEEAVAERRGGPLCEGCLTQVESGESARARGAAGEDDEDDEQDE